MEELRSKAAFFSEDATWQAVEAWLRHSLSEARKRNDFLLAPDQTAAIRGEIAFIKRALKMPEQMKRAISPQGVRRNIAGQERE
jgi:hypothetical protein